MDTVTSDRIIRFEEAARAAGTDKLEHGYLQYYAENLPEEVASLLEIGCLKGASLKMWDALFGDACDIHTIDLFQGKGKMTVRECRKAGFVPHEGDQSNIHFLYKIDKQFQLIIDDGSHQSNHQLISFKHLFQNNLQPGGLYVVEDAHCCLQQFYWTEGVKSYEDTILAMMKAWPEQIGNPYFGSSADMETFFSMIDWVKVYDDKIIFIKRK